MCWATFHEALMQRAYMKRSLLRHTPQNLLCQAQTTIPRSTDLTTAIFPELTQQETAGARMHPSAAKERPGRSPAGASLQQTLS